MQKIQKLLKPNLSKPNNFPGNICLGHICPTSLNTEIIDTNHHFCEPNILLDSASFLDPKFDKTFVWTDMFEVNIFCSQSFYPKIFWSQNFPWTNIFLSTKIYLTKICGT